MKALLVATAAFFLVLGLLVAGAVIVILIGVVRLMNHIFRSL